MKRKQLKAYLTIEVSFLIPLILALFLSLIMLIFSAYDKNILNGAAYETAVAGSLKMRENETPTEGELVSYCRERLDGKVISLQVYAIEVSISKSEVTVEISAGRNGFLVSVIKRAAVTEPEKKIREIRRLDIKNGTKNND